MTCTSLFVQRFTFVSFCVFVFLILSVSCAFCSCCEVGKLAAHCTSFSPAAMLESCDSNQVHAVGECDESTAHGQKRGKEVNSAESVKRCCADYAIVSKNSY